MKPIVYAPADRPDVETLVDGVWLPGSLRMWSHRDGAWVADVAYRRDGDVFIGTFAAEDVREDTVDRSYGRGVGGDS